LEIGLFAPSNDADHLSGLMIHRLEAKKLPACVERLTISVTLSGPLRSVQTSLFDDQFYDANFSTVCMSGSAISRLIDSLSGRLGRDAVVVVKMEDNPLPEKAFSVSPLAGNGVLAEKPAISSVIRSRKTAKSSPRFPPHANVSAQYSWRKHSADQECPAADSISYPPSPDDAMRRPFSLLTQPIPLAVAFENGPFRWNVSSPQLPTRIRINGVIHLVAAHWGAERIETGWWKGPSIRRDYYRIETVQGRWWWIFRNLVSKTQAPDTNSRYRWMLHGRFT
jgi:protein ImuB